MPGFNNELLAAERMVLAIDTSSPDQALELMQTAKEAGAWVVKLGLELSTATSWSDCSEMAALTGLEWVADAKLKDIPTTVAGAVNNITGLSHPPVAITIHTKSGVKSLEAAQRIAGERDIMMLGVTHLTSQDEAETLKYEMALPRVVVWREARRAVAGGIGGLVSSAQEVGMLKRFKKTNGLYTMIPGTRSAGANMDDQKRPRTPFEAVRDGADLLVIGRQVTGSGNPPEALAEVAVEIGQGLEARKNRKLERIAA